MDLQPPVWGEDDEPDVEDAFGAHDIEYWVWSGTKLVPASPEQAALLRLERWRSAQVSMRTATERSLRPPVVARLIRALRFRPMVALTGIARGHSGEPDDPSTPAREAGPTHTQRPAPKS